MLRKKMSFERRLYIGTMKLFMWISAGLTCALVLFLIAYVLYKGIPNISRELISTSPSYLSGKIGILPDILNTIYIVLATLVYVIPLGVGAAIYLTEYAQNKRQRRFREYRQLYTDLWECCFSVSFWICRPRLWRGRSHLSS